MKRIKNILIATLCTAVVACTATCSVAFAEGVGYGNITNEASPEQIVNEAAAGDDALATNPYDTTTSSESSLTASGTASATSSQPSTMSGVVIAPADLDDTASVSTSSTSSKAEFFTKTSDGGFSIVLIVGLIAFGLAAIGIAFFIYSQFIHKVVVRKKLEREGRFEEVDEDSINQEAFDTAYQEIAEENAMTAEHALHADKDIHTEETVTAEGDKTTVFGQVEKKAKHEDASHPHHLSDSDKRKVDSIDWDTFFNDNKNDDKKE